MPQKQYISTSGMLNKDGSWHVPWLKLKAMTQHSIPLCHYRYFLYIYDMCLIVNFAKKIFRENSIHLGLAGLVK
jgi:hypothetical protein